MDIILDIQNIQKSFAINYGAGRAVFGNEYKNIINNLTMQVPAAQVTALVGGNGAGKTTLFNLISGLIRPESGKIYYHFIETTIECTGASPWKIADSGIGRMFQGSRVYSGLSVLDNLLIQARQKMSESPISRLRNPIAYKKDDKELMDSIYERIKVYGELNELWANKSQAASSLSFAQQRMLSLAGLILGDYHLLLLDEPSSGLNPESFDTLYRIIKDLKEKGKSIFLIEHNMEFIREIVDQCHFLTDGSILFSGPPEEVLNHEEVKQSYLL